MRTDRRQQRRQRSHRRGRHPGRPGASIARPARRRPARAATGHRHRRFPAHSRPGAGAPRGHHGYPARVDDETHAAVPSEIAQHQRTGFAGALGMELRAVVAALLHHGSEQAAMVAGSHRVDVQWRRIAVHEVGAGALGYPAQQQRLTQRQQAVPAHVRHADATGRHQLAHHPGNQSQCLHAGLFGALEQQLHAQADAHQRHLQPLQRFHQALRMQALHAGTGGADAGQDHPLRTGQAVRIAHQPHRRAQSLQCVAHRTEVGATGIDQRNVAHSAPWCSAAPCPGGPAPAQCARQCLEAGLHLVVIVVAAHLKVEVQAAGIAQRAEEVRHQLGGHVTHRSRLNSPSNTKYGRPLKSSAALASVSSIGSVKP